MAGRRLPWNLPKLTHCFWISGLQNTEVFAAVSHTSWPCFCSPRKPTHIFFSQAGNAGAGLGVHTASSPAAPCLVLQSQSGSQRATLAPCCPSPCEGSWFLFPGLVLCPVTLPRDTSTQLCPCRGLVSWPQDFFQLPNPLTPLSAHCSPKSGN